MSRSTRTIRTLASIYGLTAVGVAIAFIATPTLLGLLGEERFGAIRVLTDWFGYIALLQVGISGAISPLLANVLSRQDPGEIGKVLVASARAYLRVARWMVLAGLAVTVVVTHLISVSPELTVELRIASALFCVGFVFLPLCVFWNLAEASQRGYFVNGFLATQSIVMTAAAIGLASTGWGLPGQVVATLLGNAVFAAGLVWFGWRRFPQTKHIRWLSRDAAAEADLLTLKWPSLIFNLCNRLSIFSDAIILSLVIGPTVVVPYFLTQRLLILAGGYVTAFSSASWAGLAELYHQGEFDRLNVRIVQLTRFSTVLACGGLAATAVATPAFVRLWVGVKFFQDDGLVFLTTVFVLFQCPVAVWGWVINGTGNVRAIIPCMVAGAVVNVGISVLATRWVGPIGPAIGTAVQYGFVMTLWLPFLVRRITGVSLRALAVSVGGPVALGIPYGATLYGLALAYPPDEFPFPKWGQYLSLLAAMGVGTLGYLVVAWLLLIPRVDRLEFQTRLFRR